MTLGFPQRAALIATLLVLAPIAQAWAAVDPALLAADKALVSAAARNDVKGVDALLDQDLTWTDVRGATVGKTQVARLLPARAITDEAKATSKQFDYGRVGVVLVDSGKLHALRVWAKRPAGWKLLVFQEVRSLDAPAAAPAPRGAAPKCENPCGSIPYTAKTATEKAVIAAYLALEEAATGGHGPEWRAIAADEIALVSSNGDRALDKETRARAIERGALGGVQPTKLLTAQFLEFGDAVVMRSKHQPEKGDLLQITRVWVKRDGRWQETLSYQTGIRTSAK